MRQSRIADLHIHSYYSDGTMSPKEIVEDALAKGVGLLAIADHNTLEGMRELGHLCAKYGLNHTPAVELDTLDHDIDFHILGYGIDIENKEFCDFVKKNHTLLEQVSINLIEQMQKDFDDITLPDYLDFSYDRQLGGWKALHYLMAKGLTMHLTDGLGFYAKYGCSYNCVDFPSIGSTCNSIHKAGGYAILAHPGELIKQPSTDEFKNELMRLVDLGLDGVECYYPSHTKEITQACLDVCNSRGLMITGGSDCHGSFGKTKIGEMQIEIGQLNLKNIRFSE